MVDVERKAVVSLKTVSRHVNGATIIAPELDDRIREAIRDLGYRRNHSAASIGPGAAAVSSASSSRTSRQPFYSAPVRGGRGAPAGGDGCCVS
jgi:LacI family transcriptional regulator